MYWGIHVHVTVIAQSRQGTGCISCVRICSCDVNMFLYVDVRHRQMYNISVKYVISVYMLYMMCMLIVLICRECVVM